MSRILFSVSVSVVVAAVFHFVLVETLWAEEPVIHFDVASVIQCADLVEPLDKPLPMDGQLVLIPLSVTTDLNHKARKNLQEIKIQVQFLQADNEIFDYLPQTSTFSDIQGPVNVEVSNEKNTSLNLSLSGSQEFLKANGNIGGGTKNRATRRYHELPRQQVVSATGTINRRTGVFFKFMKSSQIAWDVERHISIIARVPDNWRAGIMRVDVVAVGQRTVVPGIKDQYSMNESRFHVPFVRKNDRQALAASRELMGQEHAVRKIVAEIKKDDNLLSRSVRDFQSLVNNPIGPLDRNDLDRWITTPKISSDDSKKLGKLDKHQKIVIDEFLGQRRQFLALNSDPRLANTKNVSDIANSKPGDALNWQRRKPPQP